MIRSTQKKIKKIIYTSSASVYGSVNELHYSSDNNNKTLYSSAKLLNEALLNNFCQKKSIQLIIVRLFNMYGPNENFSIINIAASFSKNIKQFRLGISSSFFKYISNLIWRYSILILIGSENAGMLFIAFSFGSFMGTMFDVSYGANLVNNFKKKINKYLIFIILYILISFICIYLFNYYSYLDSQKLNLFNRTVVWSLVGGIFMINSLFIRQKLFKIKKFIQICFKLDLIGYLLITILIPILFIIDKAYLSFAYFVSSVFVFLIYGISFKILIK